MATESIPPVIQHAIQSAHAAQKLTIVMTCGLSGSGKSTLAKAICAQHPKFTRLSIDAYLLAHHGVFGRDFGEENYGDLTKEAWVWLRGEMGRLLSEEKDIMLDTSLYAREDREMWREVVERVGGGRYEIILVVLRGSEGVHWERIRKRNELWEGKEEVEIQVEGRPVSRELLAKYCEGFEWPDGEGEIVVNVV